MTSTDARARGSGARSRARPAALALAVLALAGTVEAQPAPPSTGARRPRVTRKKPPPPPPPERPGACRDPLTGTWQAKVFRPESDAWDRVTLSIRRHGAQLSGWIEVESWDGDATQAEPPPCDDGGGPARERWRERLGGTYRDGAVDVRGTRVVKLEDVCVTGGDASTYNLDHFTGARAAEGDLLVTTNDDGGVDDARPHTFERTSCKP